MHQRQHMYNNKWGYSLKEIIAMPRTQFADMFGPKWLAMSDTHFFTTLKKETPILVRNFQKINERFVPSEHISYDEHKDMQKCFAYDEPCVLI